MCCCCCFASHRRVVPHHAPQQSIPESFPFLPHLFTLQIRMDNSAEEQARVLLFLLVQRHWKMNGPSLMLAMRSLGPAVEGKLVMQVGVGYRCGQM